MFLNRNVEILRFKDQITPEGWISAHDLIAVNEKTLEGLPIRLKIGAVSVHIGYLENVRKGRESILADLVLALEGGLDLKGLSKEGDKIRLKADAFIVKVSL